MDGSCPLRRAGPEPGGLRHQRKQYAERHHRRYHQQHHRRYTNDTGSTNSGATDTDTSTDTADGSTEIANPYVDCETLEEAGELAWFDISVPDEIDGGYTQGTIQAVENEMIQVIYTTEAGEEITLRKGTGTEDISGDYNEYAEENTLDVDGTSVTARGSDGLVYAATWTDGTYTYAITASAGLESDSVSALVPSIQ